MRRFFFAAAGISVVISGLIVFTLVQGSVRFLSEVDLGKLVGAGDKVKGWFPRQERFDLITIALGSVVLSLIAMVIAVPFGLGTAMFLSEYARPRVRRIVKPIVEVLAGIPSVVVGYFALRFVAPELVGGVFEPTSVKNMLSAGIGIGILVIPIMASVSEDAFSSVPMSLREASYGVGASKAATVVKVVFPAAISGVVAAFIISMSRAIGETMVATMAGGGDGTGVRSANPLDPGLSMTAAMTNASGGTDNAVGGVSFDVLFFVGLLLFMMTLTLNLIGDRFVRRVRQKY